MANQCNVVVREEVKAVQPDGWALCYQWCRYDYADGSKESGYRYIWRWPTGQLQAARGQARIPSLKVARDLQDLAKKQGWGEKEGEGFDLLSLQE